MKNTKTKKGTKIFLAIVIVVITLNGSFNMAYAQTAKVSTAALNDGPKDAQELEKFCNEFFTKYMKQENVPGAVISVVKDGEILLKKGYGYADIENKVLVDPDKTPFYICSTGKLFTGTAVLQLYEQGKIKSLDDDVNLYLDTVKVSNKYSTPVTFANLLTHTSGLDDGSFIGGASKTKAGILSYEDYLKVKLGNVLKEPGTMTRYSNLGYDLLGFLVQEITGKSFGDYIKENVFEPLGMKNSTAGNTPDNVAISYIYDGKIMQPSQKVYLPALGSGCIYSTADDMAKFMIAHLQNGSYDGNRILKEDTAKLMHEQHVTNNSALPGICYSFLQNYDNNQKAIRHEGGDASGYVSTLYLLPEYNLGFYVEVNSLSTLPVTFEKEFLDHYFPCVESTVQTSVVDAQDYSDYTGVYRSYDDISISTMLKIMALFSEDGEMEISEKGDGSLYMRGTSFEGKSIDTKLIQTGDMLFERADDNSCIAFQKDKQGHIAYAYNNEPQKTFEKINWYQTQEFNFILIGICILVFLINIIGIIITTVRRKIKKHTSPTKLELAAGTILWSVSILNIVSLVAFVNMLFSFSYKNQYGLPLIGYISLGGFLLGAALSIGLVIFCILLWIKRRKTNTLFTRILYTVSTISCIAFLCFLNYWNLLGFRLN